MTKVFRLVVFVLVMLPVGITLAQNSMTKWDDTPFWNDVEAFNSMITQSNFKDKDAFATMLARQVIEGKVMVKDKGTEVFIHNKTPNGYVVSVSGHEGLWFVIPASIK